MRYFKLVEFETLPDGTKRFHQGKYDYGKGKTTVGGIVVFQCRHINNSLFDWCSRGRKNMAFIEVAVHPDDEIFIDDDAKELFTPYEQQFNVQVKMFRRVTTLEVWLATDDYYRQEE